MSLPLRTGDLTSLQRHTANPLEVTSFIANWSNFAIVTGESIWQYLDNLIQNC